MSDVSEKPVGMVKIPFEPIPDQEHKITVTTCLDSVSHHMESSVNWDEGTSIPELLIAAAVMAGNLSGLMRETCKSIEAAGEDGKWCLTNAAVLGSMAQALSQMAGVGDAGVNPPGLQH